MGHAHRVVQPEFRHQTGPMFVHRFHADTQVRGNLFVAPALGDKLGDLPFPVRQFAVPANHQTRAGKKLRHRGVIIGAPTLNHVDGVKQGLQRSRFGHEGGRSEVQRLDDEQRVGGA